MEELIQRILKDGVAKKECGAQIVGMGFIVEKGFAQGGQFLRDHGINYHALATIKSINDDKTMEME